MTDPVSVIAATCLVGISVVVFALLRAWQGWLQLKREEMERERQRNPARAEIETGGVGSARIEIADLKERIRKLEAIASGVDL